MKKEQYDKLPKWAQAEISSLQHRNRVLEEENQMLMGTHKVSDTTVLLEWPKQFYLKPGTRVRFAHGSNEVIVHAHLEGHVVVDIGDGVVLPCARNVLHIVDRHNKGNK